MKWEKSKYLFCGLIILLIVLLPVGSVRAKPRIAELVIRYVDMYATGSNNGYSWTNAYTHLQDALDHANANPSASFQIWVANGIYFPDEESIGSGRTNNSQYETFTIERNSIQLYGGFAGGESNLDDRDWISNVTILSGDIDGNDTNNDGNNIAENVNDIFGTNSRNVLTIDGVTYEDITSIVRVDGFVITAGDNHSSSGAGILCDADGTGAECSPTFRDLLIIGNQSISLGGAVLLAPKNGGQSNATFTGVSFIGNKGHAGGGIYINVYEGITSSLVFVNCSFINNVATSQGGGGIRVSANNAESTVFMNNVEFINNISADDGGAISGSSGNSGTLSFQIMNSSFYHNQAINGGGIRSYAYASGSYSLVMKNSIMWGNTASGTGDQFYTDGSATVPNISYSDIQGSGGSGPGWVGALGTDGGGNVDENPDFTNPAGNDLTLLPASPAIDAGNLAALYPDITDMDDDGNTAEGAPYDRGGNQRVINGDLDMGAFEYGSMKDNPGFYKPSGLKWYLKYDQIGGWTNYVSFKFGGDPDWIAVSGDWDDDGIDTGGFYLPATGKWYLKNDQINGWNNYESVKFKGVIGAIPVTGDWDNDGQDTIGFYVPSGKKWYLKDNLVDGWGGVTSVKFGGASDWQPVTGDWDDDGIDSIGFYVPASGKWYLKDTLADGWFDYVAVKFKGVSGADAVSGNWDGADGDTIGFYVQSGKKWYFKNDLTDGWAGVNNMKWGGDSDWQPVTGDWQ